MEEKKWFFLRYEKCQSLESFFSNKWGDFDKDYDISFGYRKGRNLPSARGYV